MGSSKQRGVLLLAFVGLVALGVAVWLMIRVQQSLEPAPKDTVVDEKPPGGEPELDSEVLISGLTNVWDIGFLPDETLLFTERGGTISKFVDEKKTIIFTVPDVYSVGEGGLLGLAVDPDFDDTRYIYACYDTKEDIRVSRWKADEAVTKLSEQKDIVTGMPVNTDTYPGRHSGCRPRFGADGNLWIGTGDVAMGTNPQDPKSLGGKVLRVDREGRAVEGNLGDPFDPRIYSYGHRNVQGLAMFDSLTYGVYGFSVEHGPDKDDEVNLLKLGNKGWDPVPNYNEDVPMTDTDKYPDATEAVWSSGDPAIAPSGATILTGSGWKDWEDWLAVSVLRGEQLRLLEFDDNGTLASEKILYEDEFGRLRSAVTGPDDALYLTTDNGGGQDQIIKVSPK